MAREDKGNPASMGEEESTSNWPRQLRFCLLDRLSSSSPEACWLDVCNAFFCVWLFLD